MHEWYPLSPTLTGNAPTFPMFMSVTFQMAISLDEEVELSPYPTQNHSGISLSPESFVLL